jgi:hypothetical protein
LELEKISFHYPIIAAGVIDVSNANKDEPTFALSNANWRLL